LPDELPVNVFPTDNGAPWLIAPFVAFSERLPLTWIAGNRDKVPVSIAKVVKGVAVPTASENVVVPEVLVVSPKLPSTVDAKPMAPPPVSLSVVSQVNITALANDWPAPVLVVVPHSDWAAAGAPAHRPDTSKQQEI
jgi:hypothetical protein